MTTTSNSPRNTTNLIPGPVREVSTSIYEALHLQETRVPKIAGIDFDQDVRNPLDANPRDAGEVVSGAVKSAQSAFGSVTKLGLVVGAAAGYLPTFALSFARHGTMKFVEETRRHPRGLLGVMLHLDPVAKQAAIAGLRAGYENCEAITRNGAVFAPVAAAVATTTLAVGVPAAAGAATLEAATGAVRLAKKQL